MKGLKMSEWVYGSYKAELVLAPCDGDLSEYAEAVEKALEGIGAKAFEGFSFQSLFYAFAGEPLKATLTTGAGRNLMAKASSVSQKEGVWHLEFEGAPFSIDLSPFKDLFGHRLQQSRPMRKISAEKSNAVYVPTRYSEMTWSQYAWLEDLK